MNSQEVYNYLAKGFKPMHFMKTCKENPLAFICYFEVIIDTDGKTYFALPSHDEMLKKLAKKKGADFSKDPFKFGYAETIISKYNLLSVHYDWIKAGPYLTDMQKRALKIYLRAGLINSNAYIDYCYDYQKYCVTSTFKEDDSYEYRDSAYCTFANETEKYAIPINEVVFTEEKYPPFTTYRNKDDRVSFRYTSDMEPSIVSENSNYFTVDYISGVDKLDRYKTGCDYSMKLGSFVKVHVATVDYPKDKYYYKYDNK